MDYRIITAPVDGFALAAVVTLLVCVFLRLAVKIEPLTDEERGHPLLQRFSFLQLFAFTGTLLAASWYVILYFSGDFPADDTFCPAIPGITLYAFHLAVALLTAALLYAAGRTKRTLIALLCLPAFIVLVAGDYIGTSVVVNDYCELLDMNREPDCAEPASDDDSDSWIEQAGIGVVHYLQELGWGEKQDPDITYNLTFLEKILFAYSGLRHTNLADDYQLGGGYKYLMGKEYVNIYKLIPFILDSGDSDNDEYIYIYIYI